MPRAVVVKKRKCKEVCNMYVIKAAGKHPPVSVGAQKNVVISCSITLGIQWAL
jgi:hypothetical protein